MMELGFDLNTNINKMTFSYGQLIIRGSVPELVQFALDSGFEFNSYTSNGWHSLELLQLNYLFAKDGDPKMLKIIENQLAKGVDLSKSNPADFFKKLHSHSESKGFDELMAVYRKDEYMKEYIKKNTGLIIQSKFDSIIPKEVQDIFLF